MEYKLGDQVKRRGRDGGKENNYMVVVYLVGAVNFKESKRHNNYLCVAEPQTWLSKISF